MNEIKEEWRSLEFLGYHTYDVSNIGNVRSMYKGLMSHRMRQGYEYVRLCYNGKKKDFSIHRLVALAFVNNPKPEEYNVVNHIDENKLNNRFDNLEWCTNEYNISYGTARDRTKEKNTKNNCYDMLKDINRKPVYKYDFYGNIINTFEGMNVCSKIEGITSSLINSDIPIKNGYVYSYSSELSLCDIWGMVYRLKKAYDDKEIAAYQYDFDCNLVAIHRDIRTLKDTDTNAIINCLNGNKRYYNKYIWSAVELSHSDLRATIDEIMNYKQIYRYDVSTFELVVYDNIDNIDDCFVRSGIYGCLNGTNLTYSGYTWSYKELSNDELDKIHRRHFALDIKKKVYQYNLLGEFIKEWDSIIDCINAGFVKSGLHDCFNGDSYQHKGYIWSKYELSQNELEQKIEDCIINTRVRPVYQYTKEHDLVKAWNVISDTGKHGYPSGTVSECCRGIRKSYKGFIWSYRKLNN